MVNLKFLYIGMYIFNINFLKHMVALFPLPKFYNCQKVNFYSTIIITLRVLLLIITPLRVVFVHFENICLINNYVDLIFFIKVTKSDMKHFLYEGIFK